MAVNAQKYHTRQVHYLRADVAYTDGTGKVYTLGVIPAGSVVLRGGVAVTTAFNAGTTNLLDIGTSGDDDGFATDLALGTVGIIVTDEMATSNDTYSATAEITVTATLAMSGTAATTGAGVVWVEYLVKNYD
jgi:hypothetical protein